MSEILQIDCKELEKAVSDMDSALKTFENIVCDRFSEEMTSLEEMNSNFTDKMKRILEISQDKALSKLNDNIKHYIQEARKIYEEIKNADEKLAQNEE